VRNRKKKTSKKLFGVMVILFLLAIVAVFMTTTKKDQLQQPLSPAVKLTLMRLPQYSDEEMHQFWDLHLNKLIMEEIAGRKYPVSAINERYQILFQSIVSKYGKAFRLEASTSYNRYDPLLLASIQAELDPPVLVIFVPSVINLYTELKDSQNTDWDKQFEVSIVSAFIHELEHLVGDSQSGLKTNKGVIDDEAKAWDATCLYVLSPFVSAGYPLGPNEAGYYKNWLNCGKENNDCWRGFIGIVYEKAFENPR